jgi:glycosyltransferase involved in cell wall biosynthesis
MTRSLSVVIITHNEEANLGRTLESVGSLVKETGGEIIVVDSGSTDRTTEIARAYGAKVFTEAWKGYAAQKNSAIEKASGEWILSLDADEEMEETLVAEMVETLKGRWEPPDDDSLGTVEVLMALEEQADSGEEPGIRGFSIPRKNLFLGRWIKRGGFWPDRKLRLFLRGAGRLEDRAVHEIVKVSGPTLDLKNALIHHAYPTLAGYIGHMNKYSSLAAEQAVHEGKHGFSFINIVVRPLATFIYNYFFRLGFLDGREGLLLHLYHAAYISWKYAKVWELTRNSGRASK